MSLQGGSKNRRSNLKTSGRLLRFAPRNDVKRIGIFGGTFNPIHIGHIKMAEAARKEYKLNIVYFIPCGIPPHKSRKDLMPAKLRYKLVKSAIKGKRHFRVLDIEIKKKKPVYTIDTVKKLTSELRPPSSEIGIYFLIGADEFEKLHTWEKANKLASLVTFLVLPRPSKYIKRPRVKNLKWFLVHRKPINISSSDIREKIKNKKSVKNPVPASLHFSL